MSQKREGNFRLLTLATGLITALLLGLIPTVNASADTEGRTVTATSKSWIVTLRVEGTYTRVGSTIPATVAIDNRTVHSVEISGCPGVTYKIVLGNSKVPNSPIIPSVLCVSKMSPGVHVFHTKVQTAYQECGGVGTPRCGNPPRMSPLPTGTYHTQVVLPGTNPSLPKLGSLSITIHS